MLWLRYLTEQRHTSIQPLNIDTFKVSSYYYSTMFNYNPLTIYFFSYQKVTRLKLTFWVHSPEKTSMWAPTKLILERRAHSPSTAFFVTSSKTAHNKPSIEKLAPHRNKVEFWDPSLSDLISYSDHLSDGSASQIPMSVSHHRLLMLSTQERSFISFKAL